MMMKSALISLMASAVALPAIAERSAPIAGSEDFLADAYKAAESGKDFSYARIWGEGRAYDGTDTSAFYEDLKAQRALADAEQADAERPQSLIVRAAANPAKPAKPRLSLRGRLSE